MKYYLIEQPDFSQTRWCHTFRLAIKREANNLKIKIVEKTPSLTESLGNVIILLGTKKDWIYHILSTFDRNETTIITVGPRMENAYDFSTVMIDFGLILENAVNYSRANGRKRIMLYAPNSTSMGDNFIGMMFERLYPEGKIIYEKSIIKDELTQFNAAYKDFDTVICCNSIIATALSHYIDASIVPSQLWIISLLDSPLGLYSNTTITAFKQDEAEIGKLAIKLAQFLTKNPSLTTVVWKTKPSLIVRDSTNNIPYFINRNILEQTEPHTVDEKVFFNNAIINKLLIFERLLSNMEEMDESILKAIKTNTRYADIAESLYASENTIKYRIKRMLNICHVSNRSDLIDLIDTYAPNFWNQ